MGGLKDIAIKYGLNCHCPRCLKTQRFAFMKGTDQLICPHCQKILDWNIHE